MRPLSSLAVITALFSSPAFAGAGVSPFIAMVSPDALPRTVTSAYDFSGTDAVFVMSVADAESVSWRGYVWGPHGEPVVGLVSSELAPDEVVAITETGFLTGRMLAVADDALLDDLVADALVGPCGHEPAMQGLVQGDLIDAGIVSLLSGLDTAEPAVAVAEYGLDTTPVTDLSARRTGTTAVTIINPDSMHPGGWCAENPAGRR